MCVGGREGGMCVCVFGRGVCVCLSVCVSVSKCVCLCKAKAKLYQTMKLFSTAGSVKLFDVCVTHTHT